MAKLLIGCNSFASGKYYGTKYTHVISWLRKVMEQMEAERGRQAAQLEKDNAFQAIFVAPEYFFTNENNTRAREPMLNAQKEDVIRDLKAISKDFSNILIFPGSIFYKEALAVDVEAYKKFQANLLSAEFHMKYLGKTSGGSQADRDDVLTGWTAPGKKKVPSLEKISTVAKKPKADSYRAYNSMYAFLGGKSVMTPYNKNWDFKETEGASVDKLVYVPGTSNGTRDLFRFDFGLEICFDHQNGALKAKSVNVDFHVVVSDSVGTKEGNMAMGNGGYFIHASSNPKQTKVYQRNSSGALVQLANYAGSCEENKTAYWLVDTAKRAVAEEAINTNTPSIPAFTRPRR